MCGAWIPLRLGRERIGGSCVAEAIAEGGVRAAVEFDINTGAPMESHVLRLASAEVAEFELLLKM